MRGIIAGPADLTLRIPYCPDDARAGPPGLLKAIRARRKRGHLLNLDRMLLHSPAFAEGWNGIFGAIRSRLSLNPRLRELAILSVAALNRSDYEWIHHEAEFFVAGGTREQFEALKDPGAALADQKRFGDAERATLALACEMTTNVAVTDTTVKRVRAVLPDAQVVELIGTIAAYNMASRFLVATGVEPEEGT